VTHGALLAHAGGLFAAFTFVHFVVDFVVDWIFQSHAEALAKHNNARVRARHCAVYTAGFLPLLLWLGWEPWRIGVGAAVLFLSHFAEDTYWPVYVWARHVRRVPLVRAYPDAQGFVMWVDRPPPRPPERRPAGTDYAYLRTCVAFPLRCIYSRSKVLSMNFSEYLLRNENGAIWAYAFKKNGSVSKAGSRKSQEQADAMVVSGEAVWDAAAAKSARVTTAAERRESHERDVQAQADRGVQIQPRDWDRAMNRDD